MVVRVVVALNGVKRKVSPEALARGKLAMTNQMLLDMERFVPKRSGNLRLSGRALEDRVEYNTPYARIQFYGRKRKGFFSDKQRKFFFANKERLLAQKPMPGTGARWDLKAKAMHAKSWGQVLLKGMGVK